MASAIPTHLKPGADSGASNGSADGGFAKRHHGKTQSHVVRSISLFLCVVFVCKAMDAFETAACQLLTSAATAGQ